MQSSRIIANYDLKLLVFRVAADMTQQSSDKSGRRKMLIRHSTNI